MITLRQLRQTDDLTNIVTQHLSALPDRQRKLFDPSRFERLRQLDGLVAEDETNETVAALIWARSLYGEHSTDVRFFYALPTYRYLVPAFLHEFQRSVDSSILHISVELLQPPGFDVSDDLISRGFRRTERILLGRSLLGIQSSSTVTYDDHLEAGDVTSIARLICRSYEGHLDSTLYPYLSNVRSCEEFLAALISSKSTTFLPQTSFVVRSTANREPVACLLSARRGVSEDLFIMQLAVDPSFRRTGLARRLISNSLLRARELGLTGCLLVVTGRNANARRLYSEIGFEELSKNAVFTYNLSTGTEALQVR